jgi:hypothetical protein
VTRRARIGVAVIVVIVAIVAAVVVIALWPREDDPSGPRDATVTSAEFTDAQLNALAQQRLDALLEACTQPASEVPAACGIRIPWAADFAVVDGIRYRIEEPPVLTVTLPTFRADEGVLVATVTGTGRDGAAKTAPYRTENWMLRGDVTVKRAGIVLSAW